MSPEKLAALLASEPVRAAPWVRAAAQCGLVEGQVRWGRLLLEGRGVARDPVAALAWFERAAQTGDPDACNMAGRCYENGWGAAPSSATAATWFLRAAEADHAWGQYNLGHLLLDGNGVARDAVAALGWYRRAADQGHVRAMNLVGRCLENGWGSAPDAAQARYWYRRSAEGGYFRGQFNHADCLAGEGRADEAAVWFQRAVDNAPVENRSAIVEAVRRHAPSLLSHGRQSMGEEDHPKGGGEGAPTRDDRDGARLNAPPPVAGEARPLHHASHGPPLPFAAAHGKGD